MLLIQTTELISKNEIKINIVVYIANNLCKNKQ